MSEYTVQKCDICSKTEEIYTNGPKMGIVESPQSVIRYGPGYRTKHSIHYCSTKCLFKYADRLMTEEIEQKKVINAPEWNLDVSAT